MPSQCPQCGITMRETDAPGPCPDCLHGAIPETVATMAAAVGSSTHPAAVSHHSESDHFGPYNLIRLIDEGGMGAVYLAEQVHPIRRQVALKVVKLGMDSRQVLARFDSERQSLALMDHPNIARVFDAGTSTAGRPYFAMEWVDGIAISDFCDQQRLTTRERLCLFIPICYALQHAHQKCVIHRDVKPSNILVGIQDGKPVPKVIDFGIAKATDHRADDGPGFTQLGQFVGTPDYMSPEQADLTSLDVDTSTDVYSLGVVLYELLVGALPFDSRRLRKAGLAELLRIIREEDAPSPAARLTSLGATTTQIAACRRTDIRTLRRDLSGDLNWIVMKAIDKDRRLRYPSASELAADIQRHLDDQPVLASPPSKLYTTRKFVRRHKAPVAGAAAVFAALIAGMIGTAWAMHIARQERQVAIVHQKEAESQRQEALAQRQRAEAQTSLARTESARAESKAAEANQQRQQAEALFDNVRNLAGSMLFKVDDQIAQLQGATPARETLVNEATAYLDRLAKDSRSSPQLRQELAAAYIKVGDLQGQPNTPNLHDPEGAKTSYAKAFAIIDSLASKASADPALERLRITAYLHRSPLGDTRDIRVADSEKARDLAAALLKKHPGNLQIQRDLARAYMGSGELQKAIATEQKVVAADPSPDERRWLAEMYRRQGTSFGSTNLVNPGPNPAGAVEYFQKVLAIVDPLIRDFPANAQYRYDQARNLSNLAIVENRMNQHDQAVQHIRRAVALQQELVDGDPRNIGFRFELGNLQTNLAFMLNMAGRREESSAIIKQAVAGIEKLAAEQPDNIEIRGDRAKFNDTLADFWANLGNAEQSIPYARKALAQYEELARLQPARLRWARAVADEHINIGQYLFRNRGTTTGDSDRIASITELRANIAARQKILDSGKADPQDLINLADAHWILGNYLGSAGNRDASLREYQSAMAVIEKFRSTYREHQDEPVTWIARLYSQLAYAAADREQWQEAAAYALKALPKLEENYANDPGNSNIGSLTDVLKALAWADLESGDPAGARKQVQRMVAIVEKRDQQDPSSLSNALDYIRILNNAADYQRVSGDRAGALATWRKAEAVLDRFQPERFSSISQRSSIATGYADIATGFMDLMELHSALAAYRKSLFIREGLYRADPANTTMRGFLRGLYPKVARNLWLLGDLTGARDNYVKPLTMPELGDKPFSLLYAGDYQYALACVRMALGETSASSRDFAIALDWYQRSAAAGQKIWDASQTDNGVLSDLIAAQRAIADLHERAGRRQDASPITASPSPINSLAPTTWGVETPV